MNVSSTGSRVGRPRKDEQERRLEELFDVATRLFLEHGFDGASMALIAKTANASKETLYNNFGSKEDLFAKIIEALSLRITRGLVARSIDGSATETLQAFGEQLLDVVLDERTLLVYRLLATETARHPQLTDTFYNNGPMRSRQVICVVLDGLIARGRLRPCDSLIAGRQFSALVVGDHFQRALIGVLPKMSSSGRREWVSQAVCTFMARYGAGGAESVEP